MWIDTTRQDQNLRDRCVLERLSKFRPRTSMSLAGEIRALSQGQVVAALKRLRDEGKAEKTFRGWKATS
jgi:hypothetical protein